MAFWLLKTEPNAYSFDDLIKDKSTYWDGVRNYQARNNLKAIKKGDLAFIYHSVGPKEVVGLAEITKEYRLDPTDKKNEGWVVVDLKAKKRFDSPLHLSDFKSDKILAQTPLVKQSRLSVVPLTTTQAKRILSMVGEKAIV